MADLISAVGAGDQSLYGQPGITNGSEAALNVTLGDQTRFGSTTRASGDTNGANVVFDHVDLAALANGAIQFNFGEEILFSSVSLGDTSSFGITSVENAAFGIFSPGINQLVFGSQTRIYEPGPAGANVEFDFVDDRLGYTAKNVPFYFGPPIAVFNVSLGDQFICVDPIEDLDQPLSIRPLGVPPGLVGPGRTCVYSGGPNGATVAFDFTIGIDYEYELPVNFQFPLGGAQALPVQGFDSLEFGGTVVENVAQGVFAQGFTSSKPSAYFVYEKVEFRGGANLNFQFLITNREWNPLNVPFQFSVATGFSVPGHLSSTFGAHLIYNFTQEVFAEGWNSTEYGTHGVEHEPVIYPVGFESSIFGLSTLAVPVYPEGWESSEYGAPDVRGPEDYLYPLGWLSSFVGATLRVDNVDQGPVVRFVEARVELPWNNRARALPESFELQYRYTKNISTRGTGLVWSVTDLVSENQELTWGNTEYRESVSDFSWSTTEYRESETGLLWALGRDVENTFTTLWRVLKYTNTGTEIRWNDALDLYVRAQLVWKEADVPEHQNNLVWHNSELSNYDTELVWQKGIPPRYAVPVSYIYPIGWESLVFGILPGKLFPGSIPPKLVIPTTHYVARDIQFIDLAGRGIRQDAVGNVKVELTVRTIFPSSFQQSNFGVHVVYFPVAIEPVGWGSSFWDDPIEEVLVNQRRLNPAPIDPNQIGNDHEIYNYVQYVRPISAESQLIIEFPFVQNLTQSLLVQPYENSNVPVTGYGTALFENRNRTIGVIPWVSHRFPFAHDIANEAVPIFAGGIDFTEFGTHRVEYTIRTLLPEPWDSFYTTTFTVVYNAADLYGPVTGGLFEVFGIHEFRNLNQEVRPFFPPGPEEFGLAYIDDAIRTIEPRAIEQQSWPIHRVELDTRYIAPPGIDSYRTGGHTVFEFFATISPNSVNVFSPDRVGEPFVSLRDQTLLPFPYEFTEFGRLNIDNKIKYVEPVGWDSFAIFRPLIEFRTKVMRPPAISVPVFTVLHRIFNVIPDPPPGQLVLVESIPRFISTPTFLSVFGVPSITPRFIYVEGIDSAGYGSPFVRTNVIETKSFNVNKASQVGIPFIAVPQYVSATGVIPTSEPPKLRVSPHTIYAPDGDQATQQARANHPTGIQPHVVDDRLQPRKAPGVPRVENKDRVIFARSNSPSVNLARSSRVGEPNLELQDRVIRPLGFRSDRVSVPSIPFSPQDIDLNGFGDGIPPGAVGTPTRVGFPIEQVQPFANPNGFVATLFGNTRFENQHRTVFPVGVPHIGNPQQLPGNTPSPWGTALVGYPREYFLGNYIFTLFGNARVEHKIRTVFPEGWDSFLAEFDSFFFQDRMRFTLINPPVFAISFISEQIGTPFVAEGIRTSDFQGFESSSVTRPQVLHVLNLNGWESSVFGDIDRWEAGVVKTAGRLSSLVSNSHRTSHVVHPAGFDTSVFGDFSYGNLLAPMGIDAPWFAGPALSNPCGCTNRVVSMYPVQRSDDVPEPTVSQP